MPVYKLAVDDNAISCWVCIFSLSCCFNQVGLNRLIHPNRTQPVEHSQYSRLSYQFCPTIFEQGVKRDKKEGDEIRNWQKGDRNKDPSLETQ